MANLKTVLATIKKKKADLDMLDDQLSEMPEMAPDAPIDAAPSPEFNLLSEKREELEAEIAKMQEGVQLISAWEDFKNGPWSEEIKSALGEIDMEVTDIAGGEPAPVGDMLGGAEAPDMAPEPVGALPPAPMDAAPLPEAPAPMAEEPAPPMDAAPVEAPIEEPAPLAAPMASQKSSTSKKNSYQSPDKKGNSSPSSLKKEGSTMATETQSKPSLKEKLAEVKSKREAIKKEAQQRVAAAWTLAKTMLPDAPAEKQKSAAAVLLQNDTPTLNAMLRQTAKNAHWAKFAETFEQVHKRNLNDLMEEPSVLKSEKSAVESEIKGEAKNAKVEKKADDRKDAGPQTETYNDGRGCGGGKHTEPKEMDAGSSSSQTEAANRPANTINKSEGGKEASAKAAAAAKKAKCEKCEGECKCAAEKTADCEACSKMADGAKCEKCAAAKTAGPMDSAVMDAPVDAPAADPMGEAPVEEMGAEAPAELPPAEEAPMEDTAAEVLTDEKKMVVEEKIEEAQEAISALEAEILEESAEGEELDYSQIFNEEEMEDKVSSLANEGDEHTAGNGEEFFAPSAAENMEASLDGDTQLASMEDFFSLRGSDSDPLAHLIAGEYIRTAADVAGMTVIPSSTGELANAMESETATGENRDNENDHEGDLFAEAIEDQHAEDGGFKRVKQDETNELQAPKSAAKPRAASAAPQVIKKLKPVVASDVKAPRSSDIASALLGDDEN
jgi:hypothetical protein